MEDDISVMATRMDMINTDEAEQELEGLQNYEEPTERECILYLYKLYTLAGHVGETGTENAGWREFNEAQSVIPNCHKAATSNEK